MVATYNSKIIQVIQRKFGTVKSKRKVIQLVYYNCHITSQWRHHDVIISKKVHFSHLSVLLFLYHKLS